MPKSACEYRKAVLDEVIRIGMQGLLGNTLIRFTAYAEARKGYRG